MRIQCKKGFLPVFILEKLTEAKAHPSSNEEVRTVPVPNNLLISSPLPVLLPTHVGLACMHMRYYSVPTCTTLPTLQLSLSEAGGAETTRLLGS